MSGAIIGAIIGFIIGVADYQFVLRMVINAKAKRGQDGVTTGLKIMLMITTIGAFSVIGAWLGHGLEQGRFI